MGIVTAQEQLCNHHVILLCHLTSKLDMVLDVANSCDNLNCQKVLGSFELSLNSNRRVKERCLENCSCCTCAPLDPKISIANSFSFPRVLKTLLRFRQL